MDEVSVSGEPIAIDSSDSDAGGEESDGDHVHFGTGVDGDVSFARPVSFAALRDLSEDYATLLGLGSLARGESSSLYSAQSDEDIVWSSCGSHILKLIRILHEITSTESSYVHDLGVLSQYLKDCTYSTLEQVRGFVTSTPFVGFRVSVDSVYAINTHFCASLHRCLRAITMVNETIEENALLSQDFIDTIAGRVDACCELFVQYCPLFVQYQHLIMQHSPVTQLFTRLCEDKDKDFQKYIFHYEQVIGQNFLSLSIKPVQRLPRYILLLKEVHNCWVAAADLAEERNRPHMKTIQKKLKAAYIMVCECTLACNNAMRASEDLQKLQGLNDAYACDHTNPRDLTVVTKTRVFVKEGELRRWYDSIGVKPHMCSLLSDVFLVSSPRGRRGLHLDSAIPLYRNCGTVCLPLPLWRAHSGGSSSDPVIGGHWFVILAKRVIFLLACDELSQLAWVESTRSVLLRNMADFDVFHSSNQVALTNALIEEYLQHVPESASAADGADKKNDIITIQAHWWKLLDMVEGVSSGVSHLRPVLQNHFEEVALEIINTFNAKKLGPVESLLRSTHTNKTSRNLTAIPIATDWFFCAPQKCSRSFSNGDESTIFPNLLRLYLLSDILIVSMVRGSFGRQAEYCYHIELSNLQYRSGSDRSDSLAIILIDSSIKEKKGIMASLWKTDSRRERTIVAFSLQQKAAWLSLLDETVAVSRSNVMAVWEAPRAEDPVSKLRKCTLCKVETCGQAFWQFKVQPKPPASEKIE